MQQLFQQFQKRRSRQLFVGGAPITSAEDAREMVKLMDLMVARQAELRKKEEGRLKALQGLSSVEVRNIELMDAKLKLQKAGDSLVEEEVYKLSQAVVQAQYRADFASVAN